MFIPLRLNLERTKLYLRSTQTNGIGATYYDLIVTAGSGSDTAVVNATAAGTEIQWTKTAGGAVAQFISGRVPAGGFTLHNTDISIWALESTALANIGGRYRVFRRESNGTETEIGGGPFDDGVEFTTSNAEYTWSGDNTDQVFSENDRILIKVYITNIGVMAVGTGTLTFDAANGGTGDSFLQFDGLVTFKAEPASVSIPQGSLTLSGTVLSLTRQDIINLSPAVLSFTGYSLAQSVVTNIGRGSLLLTGPAIELTTRLVAGFPGSLLFTGYSLTVGTSTPIGFNQLLFTGYIHSQQTILRFGNTQSLSLVGYAPNPTLASQTINIGLGALSLTGYSLSAVSTGIGIGRGALSFVGSSLALREQVSIGSSNILATGFAPSLRTATPILVGNILLSGFLPALQTSSSLVQIGRGPLNLTGYLPSLLSGATALDIGRGQLALTGYGVLIEHLLLIREKDLRPDTTLISARPDETQSSNRSKTRVTSKRAPV